MSTHHRSTKPPQLHWHNQPLKGKHCRQIVSETTAYKVDHTLVNRVKDLLQSADYERAQDDSDDLKLLSPRFRVCAAPGPLRSQPGHLPAPRWEGGVCCPYASPGNKHSDSACSSAVCQPCNGSSLSRVSLDCRAVSASDAPPLTSGLGMTYTGTTFAGALRKDVGKMRLALDMSTRLPCALISATSCAALAAASAAVAVLVVSLLALLPKAADDRC